MNDRFELEPQSKNPQDLGDASRDLAAAARYLLAAQMTLEHLDMNWMASQIAEQVGLAQAQSELLARRAARQAVQS